MSAPRHQQAARSTLTPAIADAGGETIGFAKLTEDARGVVHVNVTVRGLSAGSHGAHIHAIGLCEGPTFATAGSHFNPSLAAHGAHSKGELADHHAGDLPNLEATPAGQGHLTTTSIHFTLTHGDATSLFDTDGSAIIVHAAADDYVTQPTGNSGAALRAV